MHKSPRQQEHARDSARRLLESAEWTVVQGELLEMIEGGRLRLETNLDPHDFHFQRGMLAGLRASVGKPKEMSEREIVEED